MNSSYFILEKYQMAQKIITVEDHFIRRKKMDYKNNLDRCYKKLFLSKL